MLPLLRIFPAVPVLFIAPAPFKFEGDRTAYSPGERKAADQGIVASNTGHLGI